MLGATLHASSGVLCIANKRSRRSQVMTLYAEFSLEIVHNGASDSNIDWHAIYLSGGAPSKKAILLPCVSCTTCHQSVIFKCTPTNTMSLVRAFLTQAGFYGRKVSPVESD